MSFVCNFFVIHHNQHLLARLSSELVLAKLTVSQSRKLFKQRQYLSFIVRFINLLTALDKSIKRSECHYSSWHVVQYKNQSEHFD